MKDQEDLKPKESIEIQDSTSAFSEEAKDEREKSSAEDQISNDGFSDKSSYYEIRFKSKIINGSFHKFHLDDSLNSYITANADSDVNALEMDKKLRDSNENEVDPMLGGDNQNNQNNENKEAVVKILVKECRLDKRKTCCSCCGPIVKMVFGIICTLIGFSLFIYTPLDFLMRERLKMMPGLPAFDWWLKPPENVYFKIHLFNITNSEKFLRKEDDILNFEEVGPIVFKELLEHSNVTFNDNNTLTYTARRTLRFLDDHNKDLDLNSTIFVPNMVLLGLASYLHNANALTKLGFRFVIGRNSPVILKTTIYNYLWNITDPLLSKIKTYAPGLVPMENVGVLRMMYEDFVDEATVFIGPESGDQKFFTIDKYHGVSTLPGFTSDTCNDTLENATEGILYSQRLTHESKLRYWRKTICQPVTLNFERELDYKGILAYEFILPSNTYHRSNRPGHPDCYAGNPLLVNGLIDISKCYFDLPIVASLPHFYATDPRGLKRISGMKPDLSKHLSFVIVEPLTGTPLNSCARSQSNLVVKELSQMPVDIMLFSDMTLPMFWAEYSAPVLPDYIWNLVVLTVKVIPMVQLIICSLLVLFGLVLLYFAVSRSDCLKSKSFHRQQQLDNYARKAIFRQSNKMKF